MEYNLVYFIRIKLILNFAHASSRRVPHKSSDRNEDERGFVHSWCKTPLLLKIPVFILCNEFNDPNWYCLLTVPTCDDNVDDVHNHEDDDDHENAFDDTNADIKISNVSHKMQI